MTYLLIALAAGCCLGYATTRIRTASRTVQDALDDVFIAEQRADYDELLAGLDLNPPDDPGSSTT